MYEEYFNTKVTRSWINRGLFGGEREALCEFLEIINFLPNILYGKRCVEDQALTTIVAMMRRKNIVLDQSSLFISYGNSEFSFISHDDKNFTSNSLADNVNSKDRITLKRLRSEKFGTFPFMVHGNGGEHSWFSKIKSNLYGDEKGLIRMAANRNLTFINDEEEIIYANYCKEFL